MRKKLKLKTPFLITLIPVIVAFLLIAGAVTVYKCNLSNLTIEEQCDRIKKLTRLSTLALEKGENDECEKYEEEQYKLFILVAKKVKLIGKSESYVLKTFGPPDSKWDLFPPGWTHWDYELIYGYFAFCIKDGQVEGFLHHEDLDSKLSP